jgi:hypothetical protein
MGMEMRVYRVVDESKAPNRHFLQLVHTQFLVDYVPEPLLLIRIPSNNYMTPYLQPDVNTG